MPRQKTERISITIDKDLLDKLNSYVELQHSADPDKSRANIICKLIKAYIPT